MPKKSEQLSVKDKRIILTGSSGFLGQHFVHFFLAKGARVFGLDVREPKESLCKKFTFIKIDVTDKQSLTAARKEIGLSDVVINNAALNPKVEKGSAVDTSTDFEDLKLEDWNRELEVNLTGTMLSCQVFGSNLQAGGSIINIASIYGLLAPDQSIYPPGFIKPVTYGVTKAGVINLTKYLAGYWGQKGIRVNCLVLGGVEHGQDQTFIDAYSAKTLTGRMAQPQDFFGLLHYLASDASEYSTGTVYNIDGGWTAV